MQPRSILRLFLVILSSAYMCACDQHALSYKQLYVGFNGPRNPGTFLFNSAEAVNSSWLKLAIADHLGEILSQVNFEHQVLIIAAAGELKTATGRLKIENIDITTSQVMPYVSIEVNELGCGVPSGHSYPFVIGVIERPKEPIKNGGYYFRTLPDGCKAVVSDDAHDAT